MRLLDDEIRLVRPLLDTTRSEIDRFAEQAEVPFREDSTNSTLKYTRNMIRHEVLNWLESKGFENTRDSILKLSRQADDAQQTLVWVATDVVKRALLGSSPDRIELSCEVLEPFPRHLVREVFVEIWRQQEWPRQQMGYADWDRLAELVGTTGRFQVSGPVDCRQKRGKILLERNSG
jgi:tRNA(Ile)-lysidine synthase